MWEGGNISHFFSSEKDEGCEKGEILTNFIHPGRIRDVGRGKIPISFIREG